MKSDTLGQRLKIVRGKLNQDEFAKLTTVNKNTICNYERGIHIPGADYISKITELFNINPAWLLNGTGSISQKKSSAVLKDVIEIIEKIIDEHKLSLPPGKKAELIMLLHDELLESEYNAYDLQEKVFKLINFYGR